MASGREHDRLTVLLSMPFALLWWPVLGPAGVATALVSFLVGGLWLSPDLDTPSNPTRRWGPLALLWLPYRKLLRHRSSLSHTPLVGTAGRLLYLTVLLMLAQGLVLQPLGLAQGLTGPSGALAATEQLWRQQRPLVLLALVGLEASAWLHLLQDGDPMPRRPRLFRPGGWLRRRRRRSMPR
ncbi:MAG: metal-binding protein [Prochlorococcaceae cyanobacterium]